ncbi:UvrD-helicase domain-containing protein [Klebsiella pneumoniae]|nr:UvrD-helicase domain-containing protein [Klebsiella pneumoniae]
MDVSYLLDSLNDKQREAVAASRTNMLVLAGAGSGKTRVLVHRIAWLLSVENCSPYSIMAVTFTNKAAAEMRHRIGQLMGTTQGGMWVGTFHGLAHRLLRAHHLDANLPQDFQILDSEDQLRLLKRLIKAMNLDEKQWPPRQAMWYINSQKDEGLRPHHIQSYGNPVEQTWQKVYQAYQEACDRAGLVDFAELLLRAHELWLNKPHILPFIVSVSPISLSMNFRTQQHQYAWIRLLAGDTGKVMICVGDDDQSIYGWRGAQVENIPALPQRLPRRGNHPHGQNYRSTSNIASAANA